MSKSAPISVSSIDTSLITFKLATAKANRTPGINILYNGQPLEIMVPRARLPFGSSQFTDEKGVVSYSMNLSLDGCDPYGKEHAVPAEGKTGDIARFYNFLLDLNEKIIKAAAENSVQWFGDDKPEIVIRHAIANPLNLSSDRKGQQKIPNGKYAPTMKVKIPVYDGKVAMDIVDASRNKVFVAPELLDSVFTARSEVNMIMGCSIYVMAKGAKFGITFRPRSAQVIQFQKKTYTEYFDNVDEGAETEEATAPDDDSQQIKTAPPMDVAIPDNPYDSVDESPAPAPAPAPVQRKRRAAGAL